MDSSSFKTSSAHKTTSAGEPENAGEPGWLKPGSSASGVAPEIPESATYKLKRALLGPPMVSDQLHTERLGKPVALAVLSSDVMSSSAYATESILSRLVPYVGVAAFSLVIPITGMLIAILAVVCLLYRQVVKTYPVAGGSYVVSRENFGYTVAQIPGAALFCSYTLTVAVSISAGVDAVASAITALAPYTVELSVAFVVLLAYGNLRGLREAGRVFAVPTYWFLASMAVVMVTGIVRIAIDGSLHKVAVHAHHFSIGAPGGGLLLGAGLFVFLQAFANGGTAMTGMEAISNAVTVFRKPEVRNARTTLVLMASILAALFLTVSVFASLTHAIPYVSGTPTVLSQIGREIFGSGAGLIPFYSLQFSTALILVLGANTSFNGFPLLVSFIAQDAYLPRPLTTRGHRLVYSNGILLLTVLSIALLVASRAKVTALIPLYSCTVFAGFTMAGAGMTRYNLSHPGPGRRKRLIVSAVGFAASLAVTLIFAITEFTSGAWLVVVVIPLLVFTLAKTHKRYEAEKEVLAEGAAGAATEAPVLRNHLVIVLVDRLDLATARAVQLARSLAAGSEVRAVHFMVDNVKARQLTKSWARLGLDSLPLEVIECRDRRITRAAAQMAADLASDGETEVLLVLPRRAYKGLASRVLHDHTADKIVTAVSEIPNVSATVAPFDVSGLIKMEHAQGEKVLGRRRERFLGDRAGSPQASGNGAVVEPPDQTVEPAPDASRSGKVDGGQKLRIPGCVPISEIRHRQRVLIVGRVQRVRVQPWGGVKNFECLLVDGTGGIALVFLGRQAVAGIDPGAIVSAQGTVAVHHGKLAMLNPSYEILEPSPEGG